MRKIKSTSITCKAVFGFAQERGDLILLCAAPCTHAYTVLSEAESLQVPESRKATLALVKLKALALQPSKHPGHQSLPIFASH